MSERQTLEVINMLNSLPSEKIAEIRDFVMFLREHYGEKDAIKTIDHSDEWTDEDLKDLSIDTFHRFEVE